MRTVVFWSRLGSSEAEEVGRAVLDEGEVRFTDAMAPGAAVRRRVGFDELSVFDPRGGELTPADGERYLEALPRTFVGTHFWAAAVD